MARTNNISAAMLPADAITVANSIQSAKALMPFLINLTAADRKKKRKMGPKSVDYVNDCLIAAQTFPGSLAANFPLPEFEKDTLLITILNPLMVQAQALSEALQDTVTALGADCMAEADEVYDALKSAAKRDAGAKVMVNQIAKRFKGQGKKQTTSK